MPREEYAQMSQFMARPIYQVMSCLSLDGVKCIVNASASTIGGSDGAVWNTLALSDTFRGRVGQTGGNRRAPAHRDARWLYPSRGT